MAKNLEKLPAAWEQFGDDLFRVLVENVPGVVYLCDNDERYTMRYLSDAVADLTGYPAQDFLEDRISFVELYHPDDAAAIPPLVDTALAARQPFRLEYRLAHRDGSFRWVHEYGEGLFDGQGDLQFLEGTLFDVTDQKAAELELLQEQAISDEAIESLPGVFYLFNEQGQYLRWNQMLEQVTGYSADEIGQMQPIDFFKGDDRRRTAERIGEVFEKGVSSVEANLVAKDGTKTPYYFTGRVVTLADERCVVGMGVDISDRKQAEEALRQANDELERRVAERTAELQEANAELREERRTLKRHIDRHEREHQLMAYEVHDGTVQHATGALMMIEAAELVLDDDLEKARERISQARSWLSQAIAEARHVIAGLRPPVLDEMGIVPAIEHLLSDAQWPDDIEAEFVHDLPEGRLPSELETAIFRIAQEALSNVRRHSKSKSAYVELRQEHDQVHLTVRDWGGGFDSGGGRDESFGLRGMRERAKLYRGELAIDSTPGKGTRLSVSFRL